jgi:hypothetical protein
MSNLIRVKVAPGKSYTVSPHPSGIRELPPLRLQGGDEMMVAPDEAQVLFARGTILHPVTGAVRPEPAKQVNVPSVTTNGTLLGPNDVYVQPREEADARQAKLDADVDARNALLLGKKRTNHWGAEKYPEVTITRHGQGPDPLGMIILHDEHGAY